MHRQVVGIVGEVYITGFSRVVNQLNLRSAEGTQETTGFKPLVSWIRGAVNG